MRTKLTKLTKSEASWAYDQRFRLQEYLRDKRGKRDWGVSGVLFILIKGLPEEPRRGWTELEPLLSEDYKASAWSRGLTKKCEKSEKSEKSPRLTCELAAFPSTTEALPQNLARAEHCPTPGTHFYR